MAKESKVILITGTSSGFGLLTAARLAAKGHRVIATMRDPQKRGALDDELKRRGGGQIDVLPLDVTNAEQVKATVTEIGARYGVIDVLINNAGYGIGGFFEDLAEEEIRAQFETNFFGLQSVTREVIPYMRQQRRGTIINISSIAGSYATPAFSAYSASKWAVEAFSEALYHELAPFGIRVCLIKPGTYKTKIFYENARYARNFDNPDSPYFELSQFLKNRVKETVDDLHKDPEEIAELAEKLINSPFPPLRSIPDIEAQTNYALRKALPLRAYLWLIRKAVFKGAPVDTVKMGK